MNSVNPPVAVLDAGQRPQVRDLVRGGLDVPEDHGGRGGQPGLVRGLDHLGPAGHRKVAAARQTAPHVVVEDARGGAGNRVESRLPGGREELRQRHPAAGCPVEQLRRAERVQVDLGRGRLDGGDEIQVVVVGVGGQRSLHADLGRAEVTRLGH